MNIGAQTSQSIYGAGYVNTLVMVTNGGVYIGAVDNVSTATNNYTQQISSTQLASMCWLSPDVFIVTGQSTVPFLILSTDTLSTLPVSTFTSTSTGTSTSETPTFCSLTSNWRGRLILTQDANNPQNVYASRLGTPTDFNYAATDPAAAWAANLSESGQIGEPITAFIPFNDDLAIVSCINSVWLIEGDPSDGGSFVLLSQDMGIIGPRAWCTDAAHTLYFVGTSGLYSLRPFWAQYQPPQNLTDRSWQQFFQSIDRNQNSVNLIYDELNQYIYILVQPYNTASIGTHLIYDIRNGGLWPIQFGGDAQPISAVSYVPGYASPGTDTNGWPIGPVVPQQSITIGGASSCVYQVSPSTLGDYTITSSFAISSYANFASINPTPGALAVSHALELDMGELPPQYNTIGAGWYAEVTLLSGPTAADVSDDYAYPTLDSTSNAITYATWNGSTNLDRRQTIWRPRLSGAWFALQIGNSTASTTWSFEQATVTFTPSGINRFRR